MLPSTFKFNIATMMTQMQMQRMGGHLFAAFVFANIMLKFVCIDIDAKANVKCEHALTEMLS